MILVLEAVETSQRTLLDSQLLIRMELWEEIKPVLSGLREE